MNTVSEIDQFLDKRTDDEIAALATKAIDRLWSRRQNDPSPIPLLDSNQVVTFVVFPTRPAYTLTTREEFLAESDRRIQTPCGPFLTEEEFLDSIAE